MAANVEVKEGRKSMFAVGGDVWHDPTESTRVDQAPTWEAARALARWNYIVEKRPLEIVLPSGERARSRISSLVRLDTNVELGQCGEQYDVVQNEEGFSTTLRPLIDNGALTLETGGTLGEGQRAWLCAKLNADRFGPAAREEFGGAELDGYATVIVDHSGEGANVVAFTTVRPVCQNTVRIIEHSVQSGEGRGSRIVHSGRTRERMEEVASNLFSRIVDDAEKSAEQFRALKDCHLTPEQFNLMVTRNALGPHPSERRNWNPEARMAGAVVERYEKKVAEIERLWHEGAGHTGDDSAWEGYNGLVEAVDHNRELFPLKSGVYRTASLLRGTLRERKDRVFNTLVEYATSGSDVVDEMIAAAVA